MTETPFFFQRDAVRLFGMLHSPVEPPSSLGFVMSHPFGEEKLWSHRVFVSAARALAERGHAVLRFDYMGAGDSSGVTAETSLATHMADLAAAIDTMQARQSHLERIGLIGLRLGASIAALLAEQAADCGTHTCLRTAPLILWDPVSDGEGYLQELLRSNLATQLAVYGKVLENREVLQERARGGGCVNVDGYEIGKALFEACGRTDLLTTEPKRHGGPALIVQIAANEKLKDREDLRSLAQSYRAGTFLRAVEQPFWREIKPFYGRAASLQQVTLHWLEQMHVHS